MVETQRVVFSFVPIVRVVAVRKRASPSRILADAELHFDAHDGAQVASEIRLKATAVQVNGFASTYDQKRAGCTITRPRIVDENEMGGGASMGAFEALLGPFDEYPLLPVEARWMVRSTPLRGKVYTRTETVGALKIMAGINGRYPM